MKIKSIWISSVIFLISFSYLVPLTASAASNSEAAGAGLTVMASRVFLGAGQETGLAPSFLASLFQVINALLTFIGLVFFGILIYAGFRWMNARGNADEVEKAQGMTREAIIGIVIIVGARIITEFIIYAYQNIFPTS